LNRQNGKYLRKPEWLRSRLTRAQDLRHVRDVLGVGSLHTICESGSCPNKGECWAAGTATFMILGDTCTRNCRFCNVRTGKPFPPDPQEPERVAEAVASLGVTHCVLTSVDRDDLPDGGAAHWAQTVRAVKRAVPETTLEALIPDFGGDEASLMILIRSGPEVISHNLETVRRLTPGVRSGADYDRSLGVIRFLRDHSAARTKSGLMLGLGEREDELLEAMDDLLEAGCQVLTIGQYLQPSRRHLPVERYVHPDDFKRYGEWALQKGFRFVESAPLVRSSYHAEKHVGS